MARTRIRPPTASIPRRPLLAESVYAALRHLIMTGEIEPGVKVNIDSLAETLGVSPTPVREALARLESERMVNKEPLKGYSVTPLLGSRAISQLFDLRALLEPEAAEQAARSITPTQLSALREIVRRMTVAADEAEGERPISDTLGFFELDSQFHDLLIDATHNPFLQESLSRVRSYLHQARLYYRGGMSGDLAKRSFERHQAILEALEHRDAKRAREAMKTHIESARKGFLAMAGDGA